MKFNDRNLNGERDQQEPGLPGWTIYVDYNGNGVLDTDEPSAVTGAGGSYEIDAVDAGTFDVREVGQTGWTCSAPSPCRYSVTFAGGGQIAGKDFGNWAFAAVTGFKFEDANRDGVRDPAEAPLGGWTVYVDYNGNGTLDAGEPSGVTEPNGHYGISEVAVGTYDVREVGQTVWTCSLPSPCHYTVAFGPDTLVNGKDFGNWSPARISGTKFNDQDADGFRDATEPGLPGWVIYVDYNDNGRLDPSDISTVTDANGNYSMGVDLGNYAVREAGQDRWICSFPSVDCSYRLAFTSGSNFSGQDFGNYRLARLSGTEFNDYNKNGIQDPGEPGLSDWRIFVDYNGNGVQDPGEPFDTTNAGGQTSRSSRSSAGGSGKPGFYTITGIEPGTYEIHQVTKQGFPCTLPATCVYQQTFQSDSDVRGKDFATFKPKPIRGLARLHGPDGCVKRSFVAWVSGRQIQGVRFAVDGRGSRMLANADRSGHFAIRLQPKKMHVGVHHVIARVYFTKFSQTKPKRLVRSFYRCARATPPFTG